MSTRKEIRDDQIQILLEAGFLPVSIAYRLCPKITLTEGPMRYACIGSIALCRVRNVLPTYLGSSKPSRPDLRPEGDRVVAVGWSAGGQGLIWHGTGLDGNGNGGSGT